MLSNGQLAPGRAQNLLAGRIFVGVADKSAFEFTFAESNKGYAPVGAYYPIERKEKFIETDNQRYDRERICQPQ